ncbi:MAG: FhaA domain-containing protein [Chloroflexota bacterium]
MRDRLSHLEHQLEGLIEGSLARLLGAQLSTTAVAAQLARAMDEGVRTDNHGRTQAPDQYALTLCPEDVSTLLEEGSSLQDQLAAGLLQAARAAGYSMLREPLITLAADPTLSRWQVRLVAWHSSNPQELTRGMPADPEAARSLPPAGAFLIIDGNRHYPLDRPVVNIGRRLDNQIILDDVHVSRTHAQLRVREGRFVLFDLGSTSGTRVNGKRVKQHVLMPGDVISIGSVRMVYGEDPGGPPDETPAYRPPFPPRPAGDQRTHVSDWDDEPTQ